MNNPEGVHLDIKDPPAGAYKGIVGFAEKRLLEPLTFEGHVKPKITGKGKPYGELCKNTITAGEAAALFNAYLLSELGTLELDEEQSGILDFLFNQAGKGFVCANAVDYDRGEKKAKKPNGTYRSVLWVKKPEGFEYKNGAWRPVGGERKPKIIPASGLVGCTNDGAYDPDGAPFETWPTREEAESTWTGRGSSEDFAGKAVSCFSSREEGQGTSALSCWYWDVSDGRFDVSAYGDPDCGDPSIGGFVRE